MQVVVKLCHILVDVSQQEQNVNTLLQGLTRQVRGDNIDTEFLFSQNSHVLISFPIMWRESCHLIEDLAKVVLDLFSHIDSLLKQVNVSHSSINRPILQAFCSWIPLF